MELLLNLEDRIIGVRCREWDNSAKKCRVVDNKETYERCAGTKSIPLPTGKVESGVCNLREFIIHITGRGQDREVAGLDLYGDVDARVAAARMHRQTFGDGKLRPWAVIKDGGTGYISAIRRACGQVAKARKVGLAIEDEDVKKRVNGRVQEMSSVIDDIKNGRGIDKDKNLLPKLRGAQKSNWGGITPEVIIVNGGEIFDYKNTLKKLGEPTEQAYQLRKRYLDAAIEKFNAEDRTVTHNAAATGWEDSKELLVKDC